MTDLSASSLLAFEALNFLEIFGAYDFLIRNSLILVVLGLSLYVMLNAGLFALPQVGFMAIGAYTAAIVGTEYQLPLAAALVLSAVASGVVGLALGSLLARLDGIYLAIATIGFSEIVRVTIRNLDVTGGAVGLVGIERTANDVVICGVVLAAVIGLARLRSTRYGRAMTAMREDVLMATHQGVNVRVYRSSLFAISAVLAGLAGCLNVHFTGFVQPDAFSFDRLVTILTATILGGMASVLGPFVGGVVVFGLPEVLRSAEEHQEIINGALIVLVIAFASQGLIPLARSNARRLVGLVPGRGHTEVVDVAMQVSRDGQSALAARPVEAAPTAEEVGDGGAFVAHNGGLLLEMSSLAKQFGGVKALKAVTLSLDRGEAFGLIGPNGSGKTTLLNLLSGVYRPDSGEASMLGTSLARLWGRPDELAGLGVARTFQNIRLISGASVFDNVIAGAYLRHDCGVVSTLVGTPASRTEAKAVRDAVWHAIDLVGIRHVGNAEIDELPYGLQRKVEIARALVRGPSLLLLDEPTAGMTPSERDEIFGLVQKLRRSGIGLVVVEHDVTSITQHCDRAAVLNFGEVIAIGNASEVVKEEVVIDAYIGRLANA